MVIFGGGYSCLSRTKLNIRPLPKIYGSTAIFGKGKLENHAALATVKCFKVHDF